MNQDISSANHGNYTENREHTHWIGIALEKTGRFLTRPASLFLTDGVRFIRPIKPNAGEQASTYAKELGCRLLYGTRAIALLGVNLLLSPLELLGCGMRFMATQFFRKEVVWIKPISGATQEQREFSEVKIATFNIGAMPSFIGVHNNCGEMDRTRQKDIAQLINAMEDDVICLQEAFENFGPIAELVKAKFPHILYDVARNHHVRLGSGLVILSRHPIKTFEYRRHPCAGGLDDMARKGVLAATITLPNGRPFCIFNTHLNAGAPRSDQFPDAACDYRRHQLSNMQKFIADYVARELDHQKGPVLQKPVVIGAGDLNIGPTEKNKRPRENPTKLDFEWFSSNRHQPTGQQSAFQEIMQDGYFQSVTDRFFEQGWQDDIQNKEALGNKVKKITPEQAPELASSIEKDEPPTQQGEKIQPVLGVQQLDHVFAIRNQVFGSNAGRIAQVTCASIQVQNILDNPVSDHAPVHVTYQIENNS